MLQVHPTLRCNLTCAHCYSSSGPSARQSLDVAVLSACLEDAVALGWPSAVTLRIRGIERALHEHAS